MKTRIQFVGDSHVGLRVGLWPKNYRTEYTEKQSLTKSQKFIQKQVDRAIKLADEPADERILVLMGDYCHGPGEDYPYEMVTTDGKEQADAFLEAISPLAARSDRIYVIDDASQHHVDPSRIVNRYIAEELGAWGKRPYIKMELRIQGLRILLQHHGPPLGTRPHTLGDPVRRHLRDLHYEAMVRGEEAPDIVVHAHWHHYWREQLRVSGPLGHKTLAAFYIPALCSADQRTLRNVKRLVLSDIGTLALEITDGEVRRIKLFEEFDGNIVRVQHG